MSDRDTSQLPIRGVSYTVTEMSGKDMRGMRQLLANDKDKLRVEAWVVSACCESPKMTEAEVFDLPQYVLLKLFNEILWMTNGRPKRDEDGKIEEGSKND
jgi:hypothetical protein